MDVNEFFRVVYALGLALVVLALLGNLALMVAVVRSGEDRTRRYLKGAGWNEDGLAGRVMLMLARAGVRA